MSGETLRRYPALAFLGAAAALALLLPSTLTLPRAEPSSLAEFAPVPGDASGADAAALALGAASESDRSQARSAPRGPNALSAGLPPGSERSPGSTKRCVGDPARQTEDPLSPPCVAFFEGPNGGATTRGVTGSEIRVVMYLGVNYEDGDAVVDYERLDPSAEPGQRALAGLIAFFNDRYQAYGRRVHLYGFRGENTGTGPAVARARAARVDERLRPFAFLAAGGNSTQPLRDEAASREMLTLGQAAPRAEYAARAPYLISYPPDLDDHGEFASTYVCMSLRQRPARRSGNVYDRGRMRSFGVLWEDNASYPALRQLKERFVAGLASCGVSAVEDAIQGGGAEQTIPDGSRNIARMRSEDVTTLVTFGNPAAVTGWTAAAEAIRWYPEWVLPGHPFPSQDYENAGARLRPALVWANAFGITADLRRGALRQQYWYAAMRSGCPDCEVDQDRAPPSTVRAWYETLSLLFHGIQAAGPRLDAGRVDQGLHSIPAAPSEDPFLPAAYFAPGNASFVKDAMQMWWDPAGVEPGGAQPGCFRLVEAGLRHRAGEWPRNDDGLGGSDQPCQGPG